MRFILAALLVLLALPAQAKYARPNPWNCDNDNRIQFFVGLGYAISGEVPVYASIANPEWVSVWSVTQIGTHMKYEVRIRNMQDGLMALPEGEKTRLFQYKIDSGVAGTPGMSMVSFDFIGMGKSGKKEALLKITCRAPPE